jgi:transcriptional regulator of acetoin/glycerol metabolism
MRPAPAVIAISGAAQASEGFALAVHGVRAFIPKAELADRMDELVYRARTAPALDPFLKAQVGVRGVKELQETVRDTMLDQALALEEGNAPRAAKRLGITRQALHQLLQRRKKGE